MVTFEPGLLLRTMFGSVVLSQLGWVHGPTRVGFCVDIHGHQRTHSCPGSGQQPVTMLVSESHATIETMLIWVACASTWGHDVLQAQEAAVSHIWVWVPGAARIYVDICGSYCHQAVCVDAQDLDSHLSPCWCLRTLLSPKP